MTYQRTGDLDDKELLFIAHLLYQGGDAIARRICEDIDPTLRDLFTPAEQDAKMRDYDDFNSNGVEYIAGYWPSSGFVHSHSMSLRIIAHLAHKHGLGPVNYNTNIDKMLCDIKDAIVLSFQQ